MLTKAICEDKKWASLTFYLRRSQFTELNKEKIRIEAKNVSVPESSFDTSKYIPAHPKAREARGHFRVTFHHYFDPTPHRTH